MFGLGRNTRNTRYSRNAGGSSKLRGALLAGAGLLAYRWWQNRKHAEATTARGTPTSNGSSAWSPRGQATSHAGFAAGGTTPGGSAF